MSITTGKNSSVFPRNLNSLYAVGNVMQADKLSSNKILQFLNKDAGYYADWPIMDVKRLLSLLSEYAYFITANTWPN